jgi:branched-subunit amino acid transport protein
MSQEALWAVILGGMIVTYLTRLSFVLLIPTSRLPVALRRGLRFVPPAVLSAIIAPMLLMPAGRLDVSLHNTRLLAGAVAALVALKTRNAWLTIATGILAMILLILVFPTGS